LKTIIIFLLLIFTFNIYSAEITTNNKCNFQSIKKSFKLVSKLESDKVAHCTFSCILQLRCGRVFSFYSGVAKEVIDIFGKGNADYYDLKADFVGLNIANIVDSEEGCFDICSNY